MTMQDLLLAQVLRRTDRAVILTDVGRRITWVNDGFERVTGYALADALGRSPGALLQCAGTDAGTVARLRAAIDAGQPFTCELLNRRKDGRVFWVELEIQPLHEESGALAGYVGLQTDITDRRRAESALRASRGFLDNTGRIAGVGGWEYDLHTGDVHWSEQACRLLDLDPDASFGLRQVLRHCEPAARRQLLKAVRAGVGIDRTLDVELPFRTVAGRLVWLRVVAEGAYADGGLARMMGAVQDVTARRAMQAEVQRSADLLRGAIDALDEAFVLYGPDDRVVFCNDKCRSLQGPAAHAMVPGARFVDVMRAGVAHGLYPDAAGREEAWVAERLALHLLAQGAQVQTMADGRVLRIVERRMPDGHVVGFRIDITELVRATAAAEQASRAKSDFIATISHELRTPLQSIIGFSELGRMFAAEHAQFTQMFDDIHAGGHRMLRLVDALLDVSKIDGTMGSLALRRHDVAALAHEVLHELRPLAERGRLRICGPGPAPLWADVDAWRIQQVMRNVLANALRFAPAESEIHVQAIDHGAAGVELCVRDHGPGIPPGELESIFDAFVQSSRTRDGSGGTGLGLTICRRIMGAHGGSIAAANAEGGGALMRIRLPASASGRDPVLRPVAATLEHS